MEKRQYIILLVAFAIVIGSILGMKGLSSMKEAPKMEKPQAAKKYVKTRPVSYQQLQTNVVGYGRVQSARSLNLLSEVAGRMHQGDVRLKAGSDFKKGTLLFYIDPKESELNLMAEKSNFLKDIAAILPDIKIDFTESFDKWSNYFGSIDIDKDLPELPEVDANKEKTYMATKGIYSRFYTIRSAEERLKKHFYYAPFDGSISEVVVESGAYVNPGLKIGKIIHQGLTELKISVETREIPWITKGAKAQIHTEDDQRYFTGTVSRVSDFVNQNTQSVDVFVTIHNKGRKVYDGQFMKATIPAQVIKNGMRIPRNVIYNGNEVFVLEDSLLSVHEVKVLRLTEDEAIVNGLNDGADLVIEQLLNAHNNMKAFKFDVGEMEAVASPKETSTSTQH